MAKDVAAPEYPGDVLDPNADPGALLQEPDNLSAFGETAVRPAAPAKNDAAGSADQKRFEYHQSRADKAEAKLRALEQEYEAVKPVLPLINVIQRDGELQNKVRQHLGGPKPLEAPQKPDAYNEVEAYSNPESQSFKYRIENERYRDAKVTLLEKQLAKSYEEQQGYVERQRQTQAQEMARMKFQQEIIEMGINPQDVPEFFNLVNGASKQEMVEYFNWKKGRSSGPQFDVPGGSYPSRPGRAPAYGTPVDISEDILKLARDFR